MTTIREHLKALEEANDLLTVSESVHWSEEAATIAAEALRHNCAAVRFESTPGIADFASGVYAGPDQISAQTHRPWRRIAIALGLGWDYDYTQLLDTLSSPGERSLDRSTFTEPVATADESIDLYSLGLPAIDTDGRQRITLGLIALEHNGSTTWAPVRGVIHRRSQLRLAVPRRFVEWCNGEQPASLALGVPAASLIAALQGWILDRSAPAVPELAADLADIPIATVDGRIVPASAEVRIDGPMQPIDDRVPGPVAIWERGCETAAVTIQAESIATRDSPIIPFAPLGTPLTDDVHLTSIVKAAELYRRVNGYWGVSPVSWIQLPVESRLGLCLVSSEILYSGFDWQLANALFSFSEFFDKIVILDEHSDPTDLAQAFDDMWIKAHPGNDWIFSEPNAPAASAPVYRRRGTTGSRLYINATWDPTWDEEYIAPRVTFESSFPEDIRESVLERWNDLDFDIKGDSE